MSELRFTHEFDPGAARVEELAALHPENPMTTAAYAAARARMGERTLLLGLSRDGQFVEGCLGFLSGRANGHLEVPSAPDVPAAGPFWDGVDAMIRGLRIRGVEIGSFGSAGVDLPRWPSESRRTARTEWVVDLTSEGPVETLSNGHRRNAKKARDAGVEFRLRTGRDGLQDHLSSFESSMDRRAERGESVPRDLGRAQLEAWLETGAADLAQAFLGARVLSSILVLRSRKGAYYQSSGTTEEGRQLGASPYLVIELARALGAQDVEQFNLGGAHTDNPGLQRFKQGFGARPVPLESAAFSTGSGAVHKLLEFGRLARAAVSTRSLSGR